MRFSERHGARPVKVGIQMESMDRDLRVGLQNLFEIYVLLPGAPRYGNTASSPLSAFFTHLWIKHLKEPVHNIPYTYTDLASKLRDTFEFGHWFDVYDLLEFAAANLPDHLRVQFVSSLNPTLEAELSGYRYISNQFVPISSDIEIQGIELALDANFTPANARLHLQRALELLSDRPNADYRNSIKESVSAVEAIAREVSGDNSPSLGTALAVLERHGKMHAALRKSLIALYGYTSDADGIRHALLEESTLSSSDAIFMLVACSAFVSYMTSKNAAA